MVVINGSVVVGVFVPARFELLLLLCYVLGYELVEHPDVAFRSGMKRWGQTAVDIYGAALIYIIAINTFALDPLIDLALELIQQPSITLHYTTFPIKTIPVVNITNLIVGPTLGLLLLLLPYNYLNAVLLIK
jgi:hypothetical protein